MKFNLRFKTGDQTVAYVTGVLEHETPSLAALEDANGLMAKALVAVPLVEAHLEQLTGLRVHVEQVD